MSKTDESDSWVDIYDFLGTEAPIGSPKAVKELLRALIDSNAFYSMSEVELQSFLGRRKVLNLNGNRHFDFLNNLAKTCKTKAGLEAIKDYATSDSEIPPNTSHYNSDEEQLDEDAKIDDTEIETATSEELAILVENDNTLDSDVISPIEQILSSTEILDSISTDKEAIQFYVTYAINQLWKDAFLDPEKTITTLENETKTDNKYRNLVVQTFLKDYRGTVNLKIPKNYRFNDNSKIIDPFLMQKFVAYTIKQLPHFGNFSGTGAGKTLSAILASRVIDSKVTLIICPNDVVFHWKKNADEIFSDSVITTGKDVFSAKSDESRHQYWVLNYDKLNQDSSRDNVELLGKQKIDFVVLDEIHFSKVTGTDESKSKRRLVLEFLLTLARKKNPELKVLGLSATPVVNNLQEGRSLLELMSGKMYDDISTRPTVPNAVTLYEKFTINSIRYKPNYDISVIKNEVDVDSERPTGTSLKELNSRPLAIEQYLTDARIPEIIKRIDGPTIIYSEYVGSSIKNKPTIIETIENALKEKGYSYGFYTGDDHTGLQRFLDKEFQVLVASRPISTGIDGLQSVCTNLIFNTLPWTHALYQQILGRIVRTGQGKKTVNIHHIKASIGGYAYDEMKLNRLKFKRTLADCAVDGLLPEKNLISAAQASKEAIRWLERLERGEISCITRRDLNRILLPMEIKQRQTQYGDFTKQKQKINSEDSSATNQRMMKNPEEWHEYHRNYREERKSWKVIPFNEWIKRIKKLPERYIVGDFGCGEAKIAEALGSRIINFDHVAMDSSIVSCDMSDVSQYVKDDELDVALFSLSLIGKNWQDYLKEASRCLNDDGLLFISETTQSSKLENIRDEIKNLGFEIYKDNEVEDFTFIEARKIVVSE
ncbi:MAG: DEAD/DEAH box helicase family protein [Candidatus Nitrosopelagicus sp.]|nr:DEAD/DEAH box helicase family protein [Candidatus Nitrosopelagicus sp.]